MVILEGFIIQSKPMQGSISIQQYLGSWRTGYTYNLYNYFATTTYFFDDKTPSYIR